MFNSVRVLIAIATFLGATPLAVQAEILIGFAGAITGPWAWGTEQHRRGAENAVADLNAAGGVLGQPVGMITADDHCDGEQAVAAADKLIAARVVFVVGHICSGASIPASEVYAKAGVLMLSPGSTNPQLTERGLGNVFRVVGRTTTKARWPPTTSPGTGATDRSRSFTTPKPMARGLPKRPGAAASTRRDRGHVRGHQPRRYRLFERGRRPSGARRRRPLLCRLCCLRRPDHPAGAGFGLPAAAGGG